MPNSKSTSISFSKFFKNGLKSFLLGSKNLPGAGKTLPASGNISESKALVSLGFNNSSVCSLSLVTDLSLGVIGTASCSLIFPVSLSFFLIVFKGVANSVTLDFEARMFFAAFDAAEPISRIPLTNPLLLIIYLSL